MHEKRKPKYRVGALELGWTDKDAIGGPVELLGPEAIPDVHNLTMITGVETGVDRSGFCKDVCGFEKVVGFDHYFYYQIEDWHDKNTVISERGLGYLEEKDGKTFLVRHKPVAYKDQHGRQYPLPKGMYADLGAGAYMLAYTIPPPTYIEALSIPHSLVASTSEGNPTPVELEPNTLLGRMDNVVQAIDSDELMRIVGDKVVDPLINSQKQLDLKARHLRLTRKNSSVASPIVRLLPQEVNDKTPRQRGSIIFNSQTNRLQCYDGEKWKTIAWEEEE
tara:strand:+ start:742 stop:1572 length:831 start_codon:yes stop_codon:yes gene_type:complete